MSHNGFDSTSANPTARSDLWIDSLDELGHWSGPCGSARCAQDVPPGSALLAVTRGPSAGSLILLDQPVTTAGRHPGSDIFFDDLTVSPRHAEFWRELPCQGAVR